MTTEMLQSVWPEWQIERQLGKGSYGAVYEAVRRDHNVESHSAIKVITIPTDAAETDTLRSEGFDENATRAYFNEIVNDFVSEIQLMESLKGAQNIVGVEDYKVVERTDAPGWDIYIRMELLTPFSTYISDKTLTEQEVIKLGCDICTALEICDKRNVIHRDIKPENIFVSEFGDFKLGDFGIARKLENAAGGLSQKGTFNYMAPEVNKGTEYDRRVDIYSLGIVLYRLLNDNRLPFLETQQQLLSPSERRNAVDRRLRGEELPPPCNASPDVAKLVLCACAYDPNMRFATASAMKQALMNAGRQTVETQTDELDKTVSVRRSTAEFDPDATTAVRKAQQEKPEVATFGDEPKKKLKLPIIIAAAAAVVILVIAAIFIIPAVFGGDDDSQEENSGTETSAEGEGTTGSEGAAEGTPGDTTDQDSEPPEETYFLPDIFTVVASDEETYATQYSQKTDRVGESFRMLGSVYKDGVVFYNYSESPKKCSITYEIPEGYSEVYFILGHLDNTNKLPNPAELDIRLDGAREQTITHDPNTVPQQYSVNIEGKSTIQFTVTLSGGSGYCLANLSAVEEPTLALNDPDVLDVSDSQFAADKLASYDLAYATEYSENRYTKGERYLMMGSVYKNGVVFYYDGNNDKDVVTAEVSYNLMGGGYSTMQFYLGHLDENLHNDNLNDNTYQQNGDGEEKETRYLRVYLDNVLYNAYELNPQHPPQLIEIDISGKSTVRFTAELEEKTGYCLANLSVDQDAAMISPPPSIPAVSGSSYAVDMLTSFEPIYATEYSSQRMAGGDEFQMSGFKFRNGVVLSNPTDKDKVCSVSYNIVGDHGTMSFLYGHLDNSNFDLIDLAKVEMKVYLDNVYEMSLLFSAEMLPQLAVIDISGHSVIRFEAELSSNMGCCLANLVVDAEVPAVTANDPAHSSSIYAVDLLTSYDSYNAREYSEFDSSSSEFTMNGVTYKNGVILNPNEYRDTNCTISYNVYGEYNTLSFLLGGDSSSYRSWEIELDVYVDGVYYKTYTVKNDEDVKQINIDITGKSTVRFAAYTYLCKLFLADMTTSY